MGLGSSFADSAADSRADSAADSRADSLADAIALHQLDVELGPLLARDGALAARVAWPGPAGHSIEHAELMLLAERCGLRHELQAWLLQAAACQIALRTRAGTAIPVVLEARRGDFGRLDLEWTGVRWGIDENLLQVRYADLRRDRSATRVVAANAA